MIKVSFEEKKCNIESTARNTHLASCDSMGGQLYPGKTPFAQGLAVHDITPKTLNFLAHVSVTGILYSIPEINPDRSRKILP